MKWLEGLKASQTNPAGMAVTVSAGAIEADGRRVEIEEVKHLPLTPPPILQLRDQYYTLEREGTSSPCGWDWSGRRGSNFKPFQMRVPDSLRVYSTDKQTEYEPDTDYVYDDYWGSVKVKPGGRLKVNDIVLLDYDVYTCCYHLIYAGADGRIGVIEGDWRYGDETNLLLPDPPDLYNRDYPTGLSDHVTGDRVALASVFIPWGADAVYERRCRVESSGFTCTWDSRHVDYRPRTYEVSSTEHAGEVMVKTSQSAYGQGDGQAFTEPVLANGEVDLPIAQADGRPVYWGVRLPWHRLLAQQPNLTQARVHTYPGNVIDLRGRDLTMKSIMEQVTVEENGAIHAGWQAALWMKEELQLCFLGESTTYGGDWPLLIVKGLQGIWPDKKIRWSNAADGGHSSVHGISHVQRTRSLGHKYDMVFVEYLINDTGCASEDIYAAMTGIIDWAKERNPQAVIVVVATNGGNPMFMPHYNPASFERVYDIHRRAARERGAVFIGMYDYFRNLDQYGIYFLTELKENMINHPYLGAAIEGTRWDRQLAETIVQWLIAAVKKTL